MARNQISNDRWVDILNRLVLRPRLKAAARAAGIDPSTLFAKIKASVEHPEEHRIVWLDKLDTFANHVTMARNLSIVELDRAALTLGLEGHSQPRYHDGRPVYMRDAEVESDAISMDEMSWIQKYGTRKRDDTFLRRDGKLVPEMVTSPPNAQLVSKLLSSLIPQYAERSSVEHHVSGSVWIEGQTATPQLPSAGRDHLGDAFGLAQAPDQQQRPTNLLALPRPCANTAEFDSKFRRKLLREVVLFRDADNQLLPPLPDDVVIAGTIQARAFEDAHIPVTPVRAETLLDEGFENDFLRELAPAWRPKPKPKSAPPTAAQREEVAAKAAAKIAETPPGKADSRYDSENLGYGKPPPGGRRIIA